MLRTDLSLVPATFRKQSFPVAIQLIIRSREPEPGAAFAAGQAREYHGERIRFGAGAECDCRLPAEAGQPAVAGVFRAAGDGWRLEPAPGANLRLNGKPVTAAVPLGSGDEVQCGDWSLFFHKLWPPARHSRRADALSLFAKALAGLILVGEVAMVAWLPQRVAKARLWEGEIARQRVGLLLDELRRGNNKAKAGSDLEVAARRLAGDQLDRIAAFVRRRQEVLDRDGWRQVETDLRAYELLLRSLRDSAAFKPLPEPDAESAVRRILTPPRP